MCVAGSTTGGRLSTLVASFTGTIANGDLRLAGVGRMPETLSGVVTLLVWLSVFERISEPNNDKEEGMYLSRRGCIYRFSVVDRNDGNRSDRRRGILLFDNGGCDLDGWCRLRLRRSRGDLWFSCGGRFVTGRVEFFRFRGGAIYIINESSPVGLGGSLVDCGPITIDDEFVQNFCLPGNADGGGESRRTLAHANGTRPLLENGKAEPYVQLKICKASASERTYLIKGTGDDGLVGVVWPTQRKKRMKSCPGSRRGRGVDRQRVLTI